MAVGSVGSYMSSYLNYASSVNQLRLQQALQNYHSTRQAVSPVQRVGSSYKDSSLDFLKDYNTTMTDLMQSANTLRASNTSGAASALTVGSSDSSVAEAEERFSLRSGQDLELTVNQLAKGQMNESTAADAKAKASEGMDFSIVSRNAAGGTSYAYVKVDARKSNGSLRTNREMLEEAASQINSNKYAGVQASVVEKDGKVSLQVTGKKTGEGNTFEVSGNTGAAAGLEETAQKAQNARYTVTQDGRSVNYVSSGNEVSLDMGRIKATLKKEGTTTISQQVDNDKLASAVGDLVKSYNKALEFLGRNTDKGVEVTNQLRNMVRNLSSSQSLEKAGITMNKDGTLSFDREALDKNLKKEPNIVREVISGRNGIAQMAFDRGSSALQVSSSRLLRGEQQREAQLVADNSSFSFMNSFSKSGAFTMNNYMALGLMMDYFA